MATHVQAVAPWHPVAVQRLRRKYKFLLLAVPLGLAAAGGMTLQASYAAFSVSVETGLNAWESGEVTLDTSTEGVALFDAEGMVPGDAVQRCVVVAYGGDLDVDVLMYLDETSPAGTLADVLVLSVDSGTGSDAACSDFSVESVALGPTALAAAGAAHAGPGSPLTTWATTPGTSRTYRVTVELPAGTGNEAQGLSAVTAFVWEARST